ncbi:MAG: gas vesicle protein [Chloroflexi bacterium]|nr:gas vesicle protein [Chloroflexota bacterium]
MAKTMAQVVEQCKRQLSDFTNRDASAVTAVSRDEEGWHVSVEVLERKAIPDQMDLLATYDVLLDEEGNIVKFDRREIRTRNEKKQRES